MNKNRFIPFGYQIANGDIAIQPTEESVVRQIFGMYLRGDSLLTIANIMMQKGVRYSAKGLAWNRNTVSRILDNCHYTGAGGYPTIISDQLYASAQAIKRQRIRLNKQPSPMLDSIRKRAYCLSCGKPLGRHTKTKGKEQWYCTEGDCSIPRGFSDASIIDQITALLNLAIAAPESIDIPITEPPTTSLVITRLQNEINREMDKRDCDDGKVKALILQCAAEKYNLCDDGGRERAGQRVRALFATHEPLTELDTSLFESTVCKVFVDGNGIVTLELQNEQILKQNA